MTPLANMPGYRQTDNAKTITSVNHKGIVTFVDPGIEYGLSGRTLFIQFIAVCLATLLYVMRRQHTMVFQHSLDDWLILPPECIIYTGVTLVLGVPNIKRDLKVVARWLGWSE